MAGGRERNSISMSELVYVCVRDIERGKKGSLPLICPFIMLSGTTVNEVFVLQNRSNELCFVFWGEII